MNVEMDLGLDLELDNIDLISILRLSVKGCRVKSNSQFSIVKAVRINNIHMIQMIQIS